MDVDTEFFLEISKADNIVNAFLLLFLTLETKSWKTAIFQLSGIILYRTMQEGVLNSFASCSNCKIIFVS